MSTVGLGIRRDSKIFRDGVTVLFNQCSILLGKCVYQPECFHPAQYALHYGYCLSDINLADIIDTAHDNLFQQVLNDPNHVLAHLLPNRTSSRYNLRTMQHDRQLIPTKAVLSQR